MKTRSSALENFFNWINDWDGTWIGFRRLKPTPDENMSIRTVAVLVLFYAPATAIFVTAAGMIFGLPGELSLSGAAAAAGSFAILQSVSAFYWNRRAAALRNGKG